MGCGPLCSPHPYLNTHPGACLCSARVRSHAVHPSDASASEYHGGEEPWKVSVAPAGAHRGDHLYPSTHRGGNHDSGHPLSGRLCGSGPGPKALWRRGKSVASHWSSDPNPSGYSGPVVALLKPEGGGTVSLPRSPRHHRVTGVAHRVPPSLWNSWDGFFHRRPFPVHRQG